jgi:hypothetical protein
MPLTSFRQKILFFPLGPAMAGLSEFLPSEKNFTFVDWTSRSALERSQMGCLNLNIIVTNRT